MAVDDLINPVEFIKSEIVLPTGQRVGEALPADPWIEESILKPIFEKTDDAPTYKLVYLELPRGHAKSLYCAAAATTEAVLYSSTDCVICAVDVDQGKIIGDHINGFMERNPALKKSFKRNRVSSQRRRQ